MSQNDALKYGTSVLIITIVAGIILLHYMFLGFCYGMRVRVAICSLVYRKVTCTMMILIKLLLYLLSSPCKIQFILSIRSLLNYHNAPWGILRPGNW